MASDSRMVILHLYVSASGGFRHFNAVKAAQLRNS